MTVLLYCIVRGKKKKKKPDYLPLKKKRAIRESGNLVNLTKTFQSSFYRIYYGERRM